MPFDPAVLYIYYKFHKQVERQPAHRGRPQRHLGDEFQSVGDEVIHGMEAGRGREVQLFLRMVCGVERPHEAARVLKPVNPIAAEISEQNPEDPPHDRMQTAHYPELQESKPSSQEAEKRSREQEVVQSAAVVEPISHVLQETPAAILLGSPSGRALQHINKEIEDSANYQRKETPMDHMAQRDIVKEGVPNMP